MFDPYHKWLGILPGRQAPTHYQLLGIAPAETDPDVIEEAAVRQTAHVRTYQLGPHGKEATRLLNEIAQARATLLEPAKRKEYDARLAREAAAELPPFQPAATPASRSARRGRTFPRRRSKLPWVVAGAVVGLALLGAGLVVLLVMSRGPARPSQVLNPSPDSTPEKTPLEEDSEPPQPPKPIPQPGPDPTPSPAREDAASTSNGGADRPAEPGKGEPPAAAPTPKLPPPAPPQPPREPVPDEAKQAEARKQVQDLYKKDFAAARKPADRADLAAKLLRKAAESADDSASFFVLLHEAQGLAARAGDAALALEAAEETSRVYAVDGFDLKLGALTAVGQAAATPAANRSLVEAALRVLDQALAADDFPAARRAQAVAGAAAPKAASPGLSSYLQARGKHLQELQTEYERVQKVTAILEKSPEDPAANLVKGSYLCFRKGDWDWGLPFLAWGEDRSLRDTARKDLEGPETTTAQVALGDAWWDLAEARPGPAEPALRARAAYWYQEARDGLAGPDLGHVKERIKQAGERAAVVRGPDLPGEVRRFSGHTDAVTGVAQSPDGSRAFSGGADCTVRVWDTATGKQVRTLCDELTPVTCLALSAEGSRLAAGTTTGAVVLYDVRTGEVADSREPLRSPIGGLAVAPKGSQVVYGTAAGSVQVWAPEGGKAAQEIPDQKWGPVRCVALSPDGRLILFACDDGAARVRKVEGGPDLFPIRAAGKITCLAYSPDGRRIVTGGSDGALRGWDAKTGMGGRRLAWHPGVTAVAYSPDGLRILSGSEDRTVRLWDARSGDELYRFAGHTDGVLSVAFAADGRRALSGGRDRTVRLWSLPK
jgi:hypothetical protein